jgi:multidrug resistance efflux pump
MRGSKLAVILGGVLAFISLTLISGTPQTKNAGEEAQSLPTGSRTGEIILSGKLFCPIKRPVVMHFPGEIVELRVQAGQLVKEGEILARYRLTPEGLMQLRRRLFPTQLKELEVRLTEVEKNINNLEVKRRGLRQLSREKMASTQALAQVEREMELLSKQRVTVQQSLEQERRLVLEDQALLQKTMGQPVKPGLVPQKASLIAPMSGYVVWAHPDLRIDAELRPGEPIFQVGIMNPMIIKARVHEIETVKLKIGDPAEVSLDSLPDRKFQAKVSHLPWSSPAITLEQPSYYAVEFEVPNPDLELKEGLKARIILRKAN